MGFSEGLARGYGMMEGTLKRVDDEQYRDAQTAKADQLRESQSKLEQTRYEAQQRRLDSNEIEGARQWTASEKNRAEESKRTADYRQAQLGMEQQKLKATQDGNASRDALYTAQKEKSDYDLLQTKVNGALKEIAATGSMTPEHVKLFEQAHMPLQVLAGDSYKTAPQLVTQVMKGARDYNDPEVLGLMNIVLRDKIMARSNGKARDGSKIVDIQLVQVVPIEGGRVAFELQITPENGQPYMAPLTEKGSADDNDFVRGIPAQDLIDIFEDTASLAMFAQANPNLGKAANSFLNRRTGAGSTISDADKTRMKEMGLQATSLRKAIAAESDPEKQKAMQAQLARYEQQLDGMLGVSGPSNEPDPEHIKLLQSGTDPKFQTVFRLKYGEKAYAKYAPKGAAQPGPAQAQPAPGPAAGIQAETPSRFTAAPGSMADRQTKALRDIWNRDDGGPGGDPHAPRGMFVPQGYTPGTAELFGPGSKLLPQ